jgi:hypothetical protein
MFFQAVPQESAETFDLSWKKLIPPGRFLPSTLPGAFAPYHP